ncbi:MAG: hypothetical protein ACOCWR_01995 [Oceanidesulfovibrio sp.]
MKRPIDLLVFDPQSDPEPRQRDVVETKFGAQPAGPARWQGDACSTDDSFEYGKAMAGLAAALKARNKGARSAGGAQVYKAKAKSRKTLSNALGRIFDAQGGGPQDDVAVRRPLKKPEEV